MKITKKLLTKKSCGTRDRAIKYIVVHDTGNTDKGADALAHYNFFNSTNQSVSINFVVDDSICLELFDTKKYYTWHCGDGYGQYGITNQNSIGIEMCVNSDGDYTKTFNNTIDLVYQLCKDYDIPLANVVRHYDASKKICPRSMSANNWSKWNQFKQKLFDKENQNNKLYKVQVGAFRDKRNAEKLQAELKSKGYSTIIKYE